MVWVFCACALRNCLWVYCRQHKWTHDLRCHCLSCTNTLSLSPVLWYGRSLDVLLRVDHGLNEWLLPSVRMVKPDLSLPLHLSVDTGHLLSRRRQSRIICLMLIVFLYCTYLYLVLWGHLSSFSDIFSRNCHIFYKKSIYPHFDYVQISSRRRYRNIVCLILIVFLYCTYLYLVLLGHISSLSDCFQEFVIFFSISAFQLVLPFIL